MCVNVWEGVSEKHTKVNKHGGGEIARNGGMKNPYLESFL